MHMYESSEALVKELESAVQQETNESRKSQYVTLLQSQKNISANLKSLGDANNPNVQQYQTQQAYNTEFANEQNVNTAQYTSEAQAKARQQAQAKANDSDKKA